MRERSIVAVLLLGLFTFGIYPIYWFVSTKTEMVSKGADIPTAWLLIIPIVNIYWEWKWSGGVEHVSRGRMSQLAAFLLVLFLGVIGMMVVQATFNETARAESSALPRARAFG